MTTEALRFPLTLWPGTVVPVPPVKWRKVSLVDNKWLFFEPPTETVEIPQELFLRDLLDVDLHRADSVAEFLNDFGLIGLRYPSDELLPLAVLDDEKNPAPDRLMHYADPALFLTTARALTRHWLAAVEDTSVAAAWITELGYQPRAPWVSEEEAENAAWSEFVRCINWGLRQIHVRVELPWGHGMDGAQGEPQIGLYSALCIQLVNHIAEDAAVRRCANETCGRAFVRQRGGAVAGQYRMEGVIYCSPSCGNAQWQREHRRKKRAERGKA